MRCNGSYEHAVRSGSRKTPIPTSLPLASSHNVRCMRHWHVYPCLPWALSSTEERETASPSYCRLRQQTQPKTSLHSHEADCCAIAPSYSLLLVSTAMSGSIHGCGADVSQYCRRCHIPHAAILAQGNDNNNTRTMSPTTLR